jgi:hypothetical protein
MSGTSVKRCQKNLTCLHDLLESKLANPLAKTRLKPIDHYISACANNTSLHFSNAYYLKQATVEQLLFHLAHFVSSFKDKNLSFSNDIVYTIQVPDDNEAYNFTFLIKGEADILYARNLVDLYYGLIKQKFFRVDHATLRQNSLLYLNRFFYLADNQTTSHVPGKTVHFTGSKSFMIFISINSLLLNDYERLN